MPITVRRAAFHRRADGALVVVCAGDFPRRALPLVARVGGVDVQGISVSPDGRRFMGVLKTAPGAGDEMVVRFPPEPPTPTGIRFPAGLATSVVASREDAEDDPKKPGPTPLLKRYVSLTGKDTNDGSKAKPYRHIQHGLDQLHAAIVAGKATQGALLIAPGVYEEDLVLHSNVGIYRDDEKPALTFDAATGKYTWTTTAQVELRRKTDGGALITIKDATDVTIRGLKLDGRTKGTPTWKLGGRGIVMKNCQRIYIEGCAIWNNWTSVVYTAKEAGTDKSPYIGDSLVTDSGSGAGMLVENCKTIDISDNFFNNNRCDDKRAIPSPFDLTRIPAGYKLELSEQGVSITFTRACLQRYLTEHPEVYRNGGGAIYCVNSDAVLIDHNLLTNNQAGRGGAIRFGNKAYGWIIDNHIAGNVARIDGGGVAVWDYDRALPITRKEVLLQGNRILGNFATDDGGGVYLTAKTIARLVDNLFEGNATNGNGGGLRVSFGSEVSVKNTIFRANRANADAGSLQPDNKDGGGAAAIQNAIVHFDRCTFERNEVLGFAGGAIYCNTVSYEAVGEKLGKAFFGEGFDEILRDKYKFTAARLTVTSCAFRENRCHGKTCYGMSTSTSDKLEVVHAADKGCDAFLDAYAKYRVKKMCNAGGAGTVSGTAGGAMYVLQKKDGLSLSVTVRASTFKNDHSEHDDTTQRAAIFMRDCREVELDHETIEITAPTLHKLHLRDVVVINAAASSYLKCSGGTIRSADPQVHLDGVSCR
jgi:predicted outer membrane repeat protein